MLTILIIFINIFVIECKIIKFLHLSDIHLDLEYSQNSPNNCYLIDSRLGCCHKYDFSKKPYKNCSKWGDFKCDIPLLFINNTLKWIKENIPDLEFIIYTGDSTNHNDIRQSIKFNIQTINMVYELFKFWFGNIKVYNTIGNHDTYPVDQSSNIINKYFFKNYAKQWIGYDWITNNSYNDIIYGCYYITYIQNLDIYILNINSLLYEQNNIFNVTQLGLDQIEWINRQLEHIQNDNSRVIIISHLDPYTSEANKLYREQMLVIIDTFNEIIISSLYGHTHKDEIILFKNNDNMSTNFGFIPGSITLQNHESSFRIYDYDIDTFKIVDYTHYISNLSKIIKHDNIIFKKSYSLKQEYNMTHINVNEVELLYENILKSRDICNIYCSHYNSLGNYSEFKCIKSMNKIICKS